MQRVPRVLPLPLHSWLWFVLVSKQGCSAATLLHVSAHKGQSASPHQHFHTRECIVAPWQIKQRTDILKPFPAPLYHPAWFTLILDFPPSFAQVKAESCPFPCWISSESTSAEYVILSVGHSRQFPGQTPLHPEPKHIRQYPQVAEVQQEPLRQHFPCSR